jgi:rhodanese-related sulfurtransferase
MDAHRLRPEEVKQRQDLGHAVFFIDTRSPDAWEGSDRMVPGATRIPADKIADHLDDVPRDQTIITYCT